MKANIWNNENLIKILRTGGVAVMPTDTIYGLVGLARKETTVNHIYALRQRNSGKPCIILIGSISQLAEFSITLSPEQKNAIKKYWPGPVSIIFDCPDDSFAYLHRDTKTLAFRLPGEQKLRELLLETGPLVAPSANPEGLPPAKNIKEAQKYFSGKVDLYIDGGALSAKPSKVIKLHPDGSENTIRE